MKNAKGRTILERNCQNCGGTFWAEVGEINRGKGKVCSLSCAAALTPKQNQIGENNSNWKGGESNRIPYREAKRKYTERHPQKTAAHMIVRRAISKGYLKRKLCEVCGSNQVEAHHDDYLKPLEVRWLCRQHHKEHHLAMRSAGLEQYTERKPG